MGNYPYFRYFVSEQMARYIDLSTTAMGAMLRLCERSWLSSTPGALPLSAETLRKWMRLSETEMVEVWREIETHLVRGNTVYVIPWLKSEMDNAESKSAQRRVAAAASLKARGIRRIRHRASVKHPLNGSFNGASDADSEADSEAEASGGKGSAETIGGNGSAGFWAQLKPLYPGIDLAAEQRKMQAWLLTPRGRGRHLTKRFVVNWLNKCDATLTNPSEVPRKKKFVEDML